MIHSYVKAMRQYATFSGRAARPEYWYFVLTVFLATLVLVAIDAALGTLDAQTRIGLFSGIWGAAHIIPGLAVSVRRLHDIDRTGWWVLLAAIPLGNIVLLVFHCQGGTPGPNRFGLPPVPPQRV
ncbi:DUF805 domain-containing protein [Microvirga pudoricolor]|uniref:DUF805 domain-containing protein n=1 Tax=Microvirga pudoricolor TaxID=2778729 RepID=UPI001951677A|nr:DUF805 domain-containing protein [Microvirga pudoricolor]MBM6593646.1 DUF805 domain-containing protein [Microvirga pudoricolor]